MPLVILLVGIVPGAGIRDVRPLPWAEPLVVESLVEPTFLAGTVAIEVEEDSVRPNVLLITVDTLRADAVGAYGNLNLATPNMDALAREGARFSLAMAPVPQTNPSHASVFTGHYPRDHGIVHHMASLLSASVKPVAEILAESGYNTAGHYSWISFDPPYSGLERGFATYQRHTVDRPWPPDLRFDWYEEVLDSKADVTTEGVLAWLREGSSEPFFLWVHYNDAHWPYEPPSPLDTMFTQCGTCLDGSMETIKRIAQGYSPTFEEAAHLRGLYQGEVAFVDQQIGRLLGWLQVQGLLDRTVVVLTSDHGDAFGERGLWSHQAVLHNVATHIPLIVRYPSLVPHGVVKAPVSSTDVLPTLLELLGMAPLQEADGRSLLPLMLGLEAGGERQAFSQLWDGAEAAVVYGGMKLIKDRDTGAIELFDLGQDPEEVINLAGANPGIARDMEQRLDAWFQVHGFAP